MTNYMLTLCYDGTRWRGWQKQGNTDKTIQGKLETALSRLLSQEVEVAGCGRTDAGVHARQQVCSFRAETAMSSAELLAALREVLPEDIGALSLEPAPPRFHARLSCTGKTYVYRIWNSETPNVFERRYVWTVPEALDEDAIMELLHRAVESPKGFGDQKIDISDEVLSLIAHFANGDARTALSTLEMAILNGDQEGDLTTVTKDTVEQCTARKSLLYDKTGEEHYNLISALHKSMRNSDPDAAVYWLARMLEAGEDPLYVARRVTRFASEDVGLADPRALEIAVAAYQACHFIGMPECTVHLTEAVIYLSLAPKSNAMEAAYLSARKDALDQLAEPVPLHIRNGVTNLMRELGYGKGYRYAHDTEEHITDMRCLPDSLLGKEYYRPTEMGLEGRFKERLQKIKDWKREQEENNSKNN